MSKPVYPCSENIPEGGNIEGWRAAHQKAHLGMTLREHYAGLAMQAILSNPKTVLPENRSDEVQYNAVNQVAVRVADKLIAALKDDNNE